MSLRRILLLTIFVVLASGASGGAFAGPCAAEIAKTQAQVDAKLHRKALSGPAAKQSSTATLHHQPSAETIAAAEKELGEGASIRTALTELKRARAADEKGDAASCQSALADAQEALKPRP
jgi:hypothetical protein